MHALRRQGHFVSVENERTEKFFDIKKRDQINPVVNFSLFLNFSLEATTISDKFMYKSPKSNKKLTVCGNKVNLDDL